jgi:putative membrane protein
MARAPETFEIDPGAAARPAAERVTVVETPDAFGTPPTEEVEAIAPRRGRFWTRLFWSAFGGFVALAVTTWAVSFIVDLMSRNAAVGYAALALASLAALSLLVLAAREIIAVARLGSAEKLRRAAEAAFAGGSDAAARAFVATIVAFYRADVTTARGRAALEGHAREIIDGPNLILLAEREILAAKDVEARAAIAKASSRVAMVTTVSPRAWVDVMFVLTQSFMLITRIAHIYSGRPGGLAVWRLSARVGAHLAVTGGVAVATDAVSQVLGAGLLSRISSKLGEGVLNGVLTARVGLSAIAVCRPMTFRAMEAPTLGDVAGSLMSASPSGEKSAG